MGKDGLLGKNVIHDLGLDALPPEKQEEVLLSIGKIIYQGVLLRVMEELSEEEKAAFDRVLASAKNEDDILAFLEDHVPHLEALIKEEIARFKEHSLQTLRALRG
jgi:spore cortex formation protein SpoVR/YcgB (stage V sporulation)